MLEKAIEVFLVKSIKDAGGVAIKIPATFAKGIPDRLCLLPGGVLVFVELKAPGKKPTALQEFWHSRLRDLGFRAEVIDSKEKVTALICEVKAKCGGIKPAQ